MKKQKYKTMAMIEADLKQHQKKLFWIDFIFLCGGFFILAVCAAFLWAV